MPLPSPPYTYDDPRLTYNEHCFYYNGGYDSVCLIIGFDRKRRVGVGGGTASGGKRRDEELPPLPWIDITVCAQLLQANEEEVEDSLVVTQGAKGELAPGTIALLASRTDSQEPQINYLAQRIEPEAPEPLSPGVEVVADPILATQAGKNIPLGNLRSSTKTSSIIFRTEVTSSKGSSSEEPKVTKSQKSVEIPSNISVNAAVILKNPSDNKPKE